MKNRKLKLVLVFLMVFVLTGCTKRLVDKDNKAVKYDSSIICESCNTNCENIEKKLDLETKCKIDSEEECLNKEQISIIKEELNTCKNECVKKCSLAKKNETGQHLTSNILCKPTNEDVIEIYKKYGVDIDSLPTCSNFKLVTRYEGLWISLFVKPLAWLVLKTGTFLNNYGLGLVIISILIRIALMPLTKKTAMQSENLKKAEPEINRINKKYEGKTDQQSQMQKNQETLLIYKKYDINPLSSCLFALIQIPLLFAFIEAINRTPALFEGKFLGLNLGITPFKALQNGLWWYIILVIILGLVTYFSLNLNKGAAPAGAVDTQKQMGMMNNFMIVLIIFSSFSLSTAICIYWISSSLCTLVQNLLVKRVE